LTRQRTHVLALSKKTLTGGKEKERERKEGTRLGKGTTVLHVAELAEVLRLRLLILDEGNNHIRRKEQGEKRRDKRKEREGKGVGECLSEGLLDIGSESALELLTDGANVGARKKL